MRYIAFISYRHVDPDRRWAKWLHTKLESYRIPKAMVKQPGGSNRLGRCFRDEEELAASADLSGAIKEALQDAEYLIVVCTPSTPVSRWVNEEVKSFAALGRKSRILALLVQGEPDQSFPAALLELGDEPLAADVRDGKRRSPKDAELRIIATLLGCRFDDLRQREQARKVRRAMMLTAVMSTAAVFFAIVSVIAIIQRNEAKSRELSVSSSYVLNRDPELAVLLAMQASQVRDTEEAEAALRQALKRFSLRGVLKAGKGGLKRVAFSPDGKLLLSAGDDGTVRLWDPWAHALVRVIQAHNERVTTAAFSPDGRMLLTASGSTGDPHSAPGEEVARVFDTGSGSLLKELHGHRGYITAGSFSRDGKQIVTAGSDGTARVWDAASGKQKSVLQASAKVLTSAAFSVDGLSLFTASGDEAAKKWDLDTGKVMHVDHDGQGTDGIRVGPDGKWVAVFGRGFAHIESADDLQLWCTIPTDDADHHANDVEFSGDGKTVAMAGNDGVGMVATLPAAPIPNGNCPSIVPLRGSDGAMNEIRFSRDGQTVITAGDDHLAKVWNTKTGALLKPLIGHTAPVNDLGLTPDGQFVATASADGSVRMWQIDATIPSFSFPGKDLVGSHDGTMLFAWTNSYAAIWDAGKRKQLATLAEPVGKITDAAFSDDDTLLLTVSADGAARVWKTSTGAQVRMLRKDSVALTHVALSHGGDRAAVVSSDGVVRVWNIGDGSLLTELRGHTGAVHSAMFSPDGRRIVTAGDDKTARIWDAASGASLLVFGGHTGPVARATFNAAGTRVVSVSEGQGGQMIGQWNHEPVRIWDARTGREYLDLTGHTDAINDAVLSPDGKLVLSTSYDNSARVWDVRTGVSLAEFQGHTDLVQQGAFSHDSRYAATTGGDCSLRVWDVRSGQNLLLVPGEPGCFASPQFTSDGSVAVAKINGYPVPDHIELFACEVCADNQHLQALARQRVTRGLIPAEKARYLK